tara:strand:+ start:42 stop:875 length:834 start_codon:yes stop_codon:yes gene_type:complete
VVNEIEGAMKSQLLEIDLTKLVLPAPEGALIMKRLLFFVKLKLSIIIILNYNTKKAILRRFEMGDTWKSITHEGVTAFVNASTATVLLWIAIESSISSYFGISVFYPILIALLVGVYLLYKKNGYDTIEKRSSIQAIVSTLILWFSTAGYLNFVPEFLISVGIFENLAYSLLVGTIIFVLFLTVFHGLHGKYFTTLMLEHMPWVINPDKFLLFFWFWINLIVAGVLNIFEVNMWWYFVNLFFYALFPSLFFGTRVQEVHGSHIKDKDDYFDDDSGFK